MSIDNSVRCIPISEKTKRTDKKTKNKTKAGSLPRKPSKNISQNNINFVKIVEASCLGILK